MKFKYDLDLIVSALSYLDLKGLLLMIDNDVFKFGEPSVSEMEVLFKTSFSQLEDRELKKHIESLMLSCARVNSIGF